ncbi:MAG TPA: hypothetical protein VGA78_02890 [Gemmatimonadales bacterium]
MPLSVESVVEFLFKYRPVVFDKGRFAFGASQPAMLVALGLLGLALTAVVLTWRRAPGHATPRARVALVAIRAVALALVFWCLLQPTLLVTTAVPQRNVVGILVDDSRSMGIADNGQTTRADQVRQLLAANAQLPTELGQKFQLRWFKFSHRPERTRGSDGLGFTGDRSDLAAALDGARRELAALPLAGLILVTDGADNADSALTTTVLSLSAAGVPVYTVGVGAERLPRDLELSRVGAPRAALRGGSVLIEALIQQQGGGTDSAEIVVEDGGRILATRRFALPGDGQAATIGIPVPLAQAGARNLTVRLPGLPGETVVRNNAREALVTVRDREERVLYFEGEPRYEFAFLRRGLAADTNLRVVGLQRTAEGKFLRLGVDDSLDLAAGFPRTREELFRYRAIILGSVEASAFSADQLRMIGEFVGRRGGGLLLLGGRRALAEGAFRDTPLEEVSPFRLDLPGDTTFFRELAVSVTAAGRDHPVTQLASGGAPSPRVWDSLPPLTSVNRLGALKPGATALLAGRDTAGRGDQVVLAFHRYGRGRVVALPVQDTWMWQMHASVTVEDQKYETFWRQLLRWLADDTPDRLDVASLTEEVAPGEAITIEAEVRDRLWQAVNDAAVTATVTGPSGEATELPLDWVVGADGRYRGAFTAREVGEYRVTTAAVNASGAGRTDTLRAEPVFIRAGQVQREFFGAAQRAPLLKRIAEETGGRYYTMQSVSTLPRDIVYTERGVTTTEQLDLWDMPIVFFLLAGLLAGEWTLRRSRGMA